MNKKIFTFLAIVVVVLNFFNILVSDLEKGQIDDLYDRSVILSETTSGALFEDHAKLGGTMYEQDQRGGSWLDTFYDSNSLDLSLSSNYKLSNGHVEIVPGEVLFYDSFESGLGNWITYIGTATLSSVQARTGTFSYLVDENDDSIYHENINGYVAAVEAWFYDDASDTSSTSIVELLDMNNQNPILLGTLTTQVTSNYAYRIQSNVYNSGIPRTTGWHNCTFFVDGSTTKIYLDDIYLRSTSAIGKFKRIYLGDIWNDAINMTTYFDDIKIYMPYEPVANLTSSVISLPAGMHWSRVGLLRDEPANTKIYVSILNATTDLPIPGYSGLDTANIDISGLDPLVYPDIKLNVTFMGNGLATPKLHYWGVSWNVSDTWRDTFVGDSKIYGGLHNLHLTDGNVTLNDSGITPPFEKSANFTSIPINLPYNQNWDTLYLNKTLPTNCFINASLLNGTTELPIQNYIDLSGSEIDLSNITPFNHTSLCLWANFSSDGWATPTLSDWAVTWRPDPPRCVGIPSDKTLLEDTNATGLINLTHYFTDNWTSGVNLSYSIAYQSSPENLTTILVNKYLLDFITPTENWYGPEQFRVNCTDGTHTTTSNIFTVTVLPVNDPPVWSQLNDIHLLEDTTLNDAINLLGNISDVDNNISDIEFSIVNHSNPGNIYVTIDPDDNFDVIGLTENFFGSANITIRANDSINYSDVNIKIVVAPDNDPPIWKDIFEMYLDEDTNLINAIDLKSHVKDVDNPIAEIKFEIIQNTNEGNFLLVINQDKFIDIYILNINYIGSANITVRANDGMDYADEQFEVIIFPLNDPPVWERIDDFHLYEDTDAFNAINLSNYILDNDTDLINIEFSIIENTNSNNINIEIDPNNYIDITTPLEDYVGTSTVTIRADDGLNHSDTSFEIIIDPVNDPPVWEIIKDINLNEDTDALNAVDLYLYISDIDNELIEIIFTIIANSNLENISVLIDSFNKIDITTPVENYYGNTTILVRASDGFNYSDVEIKIFVNPINDPPIINIIHPLEGREFKTTDKINFNCSYEDFDSGFPDSNETIMITWYSNLESQPIGEGAILSGIRLSPGNHTITVRASDSAGDEGWAFVNITITSVHSSEGISTVTILTFVVLIIIILILIAIAAILLKRKHKKDEALAAEGGAGPSEPTLVPDIISSPETVPRLGAAGVSLLAGEPGTIAPTLEPVVSATTGQPAVPQIAAQPITRPQLPPAALPSQPSVVVASPTITQEPKPTPISQPTPTPIPDSNKAQEESKKELLLKEKLELLSERLLKGEIPEKICPNCTSIMAIYPDGSAFCKECEYKETP